MHHRLSSKHLTFIAMKKLVFRSRIQKVGSLIGAVNYFWKNGSHMATLETQLDAGEMQEQKNRKVLDFDL